MDNTILFSRFGTVIVFKTDEQDTVAVNTYFEGFPKDYVEKVIFFMILNSIFHFDNYSFSNYHVYNTLMNLCF